MKVRGRRLAVGLALAVIAGWSGQGCRLPLSHACRSDQDCLTGQCVSGACRERGAGVPDGALEVMAPDGGDEVAPRPPDGADAVGADVLIATDARTATDGVIATDVNETPDAAIATDANESPDAVAVTDADETADVGVGAEATDAADASTDEAQTTGEILAWATWPMPNPPFVGFATRLPSGLPNPQRYEYTSNAPVVRDLVTGLSWQRTPADATFSWSAAREHCAGLELDGHDDWRLPSRIELISLIDYTTVRDTMTDLAAFPGAIGGQYWTSSTGPNPTVAWQVDFAIAVANFVYETASARARCVRRPAPQGPLPEHYDLAQTGTVRDNWTGLTWQRAAVPQLMNGNDAVTYCRTLPPAGAWRLPSVKELVTLVSEATPRALDTVVFPEPVELAQDGFNQVFWTSSWYDNNPEDSFAVSFYFGDISWDSNSSNFYRARCVR